jgi:hypothetical protein
LVELVRAVVALEDDLDLLVARAVQHDVCLNFAGSDFHGVVIDTL